jgi:hypothetical protein
MSDLLESARQGIERFLDQSRESGAIDAVQFETATRNVMPRLEAWLADPETGEMLFFGYGPFPYLQYWVADRTGVANGRQDRPLVDPQTRGGRGRTR